MDRMITILVLDGERGFRLVGECYLTPIPRSGWEAVRWRGRTFQLFGGIRGPVFIDVANPCRRGTR